MDLNKGEKLRLGLYRRQRLESETTLGELAARFDLPERALRLANPGLADPVPAETELRLPLSPQLYPNCPLGNYYVLREGDSFAGIAAYFSVSEAQLELNNLGIDPERLYPGQTLCIPYAPSPVSLLYAPAAGLLRLRGAEERSFPVRLSPAEPPLPAGACLVQRKYLADGLSGPLALALSLPGLLIRGEKQALPPFPLPERQALILGDADMAELFERVPVGTVLRLGEEAEENAGL